MVTCAEVFYVVFSIGVACEFGELACELFDAIDQTIDGIDWYLYPWEVQRMLPTIMIRTKIGIKVKLFGTTTASRETFKQVCMTRFLHSSFGILSILF